jgi:hypothetical protein
VNELGWRWRDNIIYLTHGVPNEPTFRTSALLDRISPVPLAVVQSTQDEFVSLPDVRRLVADAHEPKKLWVVNASDHRFSDNLAEFDRRLLEALDGSQTVTTASTEGRLVRALPAVISLALFSGGARSAAHRAAQHELA